MKHNLLLTTIIILALGCLLMVGCGKDETVTDASGLTVKEDFSIDSVIIDEFDESLYSVAELQDMIVKEAAQYCNENGSGKVSALAPEMTEGKVKVSMSFASAGDYSAFNSRKLVVEPLGDAIAEGKTNIPFKDVKEGSIVDLASLESTEDLYLLITDEAGYVSLPGKVLYFSDGVETVTKQQVHVTDDMDGLAYIIFKNK